MSSTPTTTVPALEIEVSRVPGDRQLLDRFIERRDEDAFARLVERHAGSVWGVCRRILQHEQDAEDAFQAAFVVLARKAASIRKGEAVGSWLYSVAYRVASKARHTLYRRRDCEKKASIGADAPPSWSEASCRELQRILDEEVQRLAEKYRAPFVLCCLEGRSKSEAAQELGWKEGTVSGRLARARQLLQTRLARRGVALSAVLTALAVAQNSLQAASPVLIQAAAQAAAPAVAGQLTALSPTAVALAENVVRSAVLAKFQATVAALLTFTLTLTGAGVAAFFLGPEPQLDAPAAPVPGEIFLAPPIPFVQPLDEQVLSLAFSPDSKRLVTAGARHTHPGQLKIWDAEKHTELAALREIRGVRSVAVAPNGQLIATGDFGGAVRLRDPSTGVELAHAQGHRTGVNSVAFSPDSKWLVSAGLDRIVKLWDVPGLSEPRAFLGHTDMIFSVAFFRHGEGFVTCGRDKIAIIWDIRSGKQRFILRGHREGVEMVAISPDDRVIATAGWDQLIKLWNADTGAEIGVLESKAGVLSSPAYAVAFSPKNDLLASGHADGSVDLWDLKTRKQLATLGTHGQPVWSVAFTHDGQQLASGSSDTTAKLWDVTARKEITTLATSLQQPIQAIAHAPDGKLVATATGDRTPQLRDARTGTLLRWLRGHTGMVTCLTFSPDGQTVATGSLDRTVILWDPSTGEEKRTLKGHAGPVQALAFTPDGKKLASAGADKVVKLWDPTSGNNLVTFQGHEGAIRGLAFSAGGDRLASGGTDKTIKLWDLALEAKVVTLQGHAGAVRALAFSRSGLLASAGEDGTVQLWEPGQEKARLVLKEHQGHVLALAFTPSGHTLLSGGADGSILMWDPATGTRRGALPGLAVGPLRLPGLGHLGAITALAVHPQGDHLLSGSADTKILRWQRPFTLEPPLPLLFRQNFRTEKVDEKALLLFPPDGRPQLKTEPEGLRISLPGQSGKRQATGFRSRFRLQGDFDITLSYELLQAQRPLTGNGIGVTIYLTTDSPTQEALQFARTNRMDGSLYACTKMTTDAAGKRKVTSAITPTVARSGQLRLVRLGSLVRFLVADEDSTTFREIHQHELGKEDVSYVRIAGDPGTPDSPPLEVRFHEFAVRAHGELAKLSQPKSPAPAAAPRPPSKKTYAREYFEPFRGIPSKRLEMALLGPSPEGVVKFEPAGLRIALPPRGPAGHAPVGVEIPLTVRGDFEITLDFEVLQEPEAAKTGKDPTRFSLDAGVERQTSTVATLSRRTVPAGPQWFTWMSLWNEKLGKHDQRGHGVPTQSRTGRLRLVRAGSTISYHASAGDDGEFVLLDTYPFTARALENLTIVALTGAPDAALDVRFTNLRVRADDLPNLPATPVSARASQTPPVAEEVPPEGTHGWLGAIFASSIIMLITVVGMILFFRRGLRTADPVSTSAADLPTKQPAGAATIIPCSHCKKKLRAKVSWQGKKVKCPHCGEATAVWL